MSLCLLKLGWSIKCLFASMVASLWTYCTVNTTACVSVSFDLSCAGLSECVSTVCACMPAYVHVRVSSPSGQILCNLVLSDLMRVECRWPCGVLLVPDAKHAAGLTQISATFALLAANFPGLLHVFHPRHRHGEDTAAYVACQLILPPLDAKASHLVKGNCICWL